MKRLTLITTTLAAGLLLAIGSAIATDAPTDPVRVTNYGKKAPVTFDHATHGDVDCAQCHHNKDDGGYKCGECHGLDATDQAPKIKDAMHKKESGTCYACHLGKEPKAKKLKCAECHVKR